MWFYTFLGEDMMKYLQFLFCFLACLCVAAAVMVALLQNFWYALIPACFALVFVGLTLLMIKRENRPNTGVFPCADPVPRQKKCANEPHRSQPIHPILYIV